MLLRYAFVGHRQYGAFELRIPQHLKVYALLLIPELGHLADQNYPESFSLPAVPAVSCEHPFQYGIIHMLMIKIFCFLF